MFLFCSVSVFAAGLQAILPEYLKARFVQAALSYIGCNEEGQFVCKDNDCWCHCAAEYPQCNCPEVDLRAMEASLLKIRDSWNAANRDFEESGQCFLPLCTRSVTVTLLLIANQTLLLKRLMGKEKMGATASIPCNGNLSEEKH